MTDTPIASDSTAAPALASPPLAGDARGRSQARLALGAIGVVFGDIGTSPIYAFREAFTGHHELPPSAVNVFGVLSLIFWAMIIVVTLKYVAIMIRADNKGEGGSLALLALISRKAGGKARWSGGIVLLGVFACALFYGDSMVTPAISVLASVEGLAIFDPRLAPAVMPLAAGIIVALFVGRKGGTARLGRWFGPVITLYLLTIGLLGALAIARNPAIVTALDPRHAFAFFAAQPWLAFLALGSVVLAVTGAEALYAEMGRFGRRPIRFGWFFFVLPALMLNYLGQGALVLSDPAAAASPFFSLAPPGFELPLVLLTILAATIATQAVVTGAFSVTQQAIQLGFVPRLRIEHTTEHREIYIPVVNWTLMAAALVLVVTFRSSSELASAYGVAVTGAMLIDTCLLAALISSIWAWKPWRGVPLLILFLVVDLGFFAATLTKVPDGGWFPLLVGVVAFVLLTTWAKGRQLMRANLADSAMPTEIFIKSAAGSVVRVPGTAVFLTTSDQGVPPSLLHNLKHNRCLHERVMLLTVVIEDMPYVEAHRRCDLTDLGEGFFRLILRFGFMEDSDLPAALGTVSCGRDIRMMETSFFLSRQTLIASRKPGMAIWREHLFSWMLRNAESAMEFFRLPPNRVVELGSQVEI
ncbi:MAG: system potassium uptake protein [Sphingomonadales bacterium]|jgi:KUP system potassium uptake protein|nr:system potassium uptake protein [Sphingomonadales bacterium]